MFSFGSRLSAISSYAQTQGKFAEAQNELEKMEKSLRERGMLEEGCQFYYLARTLMGVVAYSQLQLDKAYETLKSVLTDQLAYVDNQEDHPFLEQTYQHLALYYNCLLYTSDAADE